MADKRPPADKFGQIEAALDARVLKALRKAWNMARDRGMVDTELDEHLA